MNKHLKYAASAASAICGLSVLLVWDDMTSKVVLKNAASLDLTDVEVGVGVNDEADLREVFWRGTVKRGRAQFIGRVASREGGIAIRLRRGSEPLTLIYGYVSGAWVPQRIKVCVRDSGEPEVAAMPPFLGRFSLFASAGAGEAFTFKAPCE